jgi:1-acyl-sn-glycerol-3-phosphate acyltransferase
VTPVVIAANHTRFLGLPGRGRLELATEQIRTALEAHVQAAAREHGIPLPTDVPPGLLD